MKPTSVKRGRGQRGQENLVEFKEAEILGPPKSQGALPSPSLRPGFTHNALKCHRPFHPYRASRSLSTLY